MTLALQSYLMAFTFWLAIPLGALALAMVHQLIGGRWGAPVRPALAAILQTLPLFALLVIPLFAFVPQLYVWFSAHDPVIDHKHGYLNAPFFIGRGIVYVIAWSALALPLSRRDPAHQENALPQRRRAGLGLIVLFLTATFAATDWLQSLEPHWHSTIYGLLFITACVLAGVAFTVLVSAHRAEPLLLDDLGNLLLMATMLLAYMSLSQLIIIWSGNLPEENGWYLARKEPGWLLIATIVSAVAVPFTLLLSRAVKRNARGMRALATFMLCGAALHLFWLVAPAFHRAQLLSWTDPVALVLVGALWLAVFTWRFRRQT